VHVQSAAEDGQPNAVPVPPAPRQPPPLIVHRSETAGTRTRTPCARASARPA
jgi:hypothetical protein